MLFVTTSSSIFCVAKLDWQFIGNIRLGGVTPSLRVLSDRQKSFSFSLSLCSYLVVIVPPVLSIAYTPDASFLDPSKAGISHLLITIPYLLPIRPSDTICYNFSSNKTCYFLTSVNSNFLILKLKTWNFYIFLIYIIMYLSTYVKFHCNNQCVKEFSGKCPLVVDKKSINRNVFCTDASLSPVPMFLSSSNFHTGYLSYVSTRNTQLPLCLFYPFSMVCHSSWHKAYSRKPGRKWNKAERFASC